LESKPQKLNLSDFQYELPTELIAQKPLQDRDQSRLLVRDRKGNHTDTHFNRLAEEIPNDAVIIVNNSRVFASRLIGKLSTGGKIEVFVLETPNSSNQVTVLAKPMKKLKIGTEVFFDDSVSATVIEKLTTPVSTLAILQFKTNDTKLMDWFNQFGYVPLPPYIERKSPLPASKSDDKESYQTVYAQSEGSVAAPTAGLHFTPELIEKLKSKGIQFAPITLHVGAGTFLPVKNDDISEHAMHTEKFIIPKTSLELIQKAKAEKRAVIAVGTTSFRTFEAAYQQAKRSLDSMNQLTDTWLETDLFIWPETPENRHKSMIINGLITNFHQPGSTLYMLICSLIGYEEAENHYQLAVKEKFRFLSYGDSNLFWI
jgi:S-adenosylmethionine:tRNA ribosyltransferase-isomerase